MKKTTKKVKNKKITQIKLFNNKKLIYIMIYIISVILAFFVGYLIGLKKNCLKYSSNIDNGLNNIATLISKYKIKDRLVNSEAIDYKENKEDETHIVKPKIYTKKPKLVIIMDDMSFISQVRNLKKLNIKVTPSFFPPTTRHPNTAIYAKEFKHYMVHLPMQATNPNFKEEKNTLHINSSYSFIDDRIRYIKKEFPNVKFINNHTGSKFSSDYYAMNKLFKILKKYGIVFVDSRTTSKTKAALIAKKYNVVLLSRDVFLDNKPNVKYIQNQLYKAVQIAKKRGYAIAICHPHSKTFEA